MRSLVSIVAALMALPGLSAGQLAAQTRLPQFSDSNRVDVELVIAVDVSGSMSNREHKLQREGFVEAFRDPRLIKAIRSGVRGRIAVTYLEWGDQFSQRVLIPWRIIDGTAAGEKFAADLAPIPRSPIRGTSISGALEFSAKLFDGNGIESFRKVIDISGDGPNRTGRHVNEVRDEALAKKIIINGLPILIGPMITRRTHGYGLDHYFEDCVIGGPAAFVFPVYEQMEMTEAIRRKLILEISGRLPEHFNNASAYGDPRSSSERLSRAVAQPKTRSSSERLSRAAAQPKTRSSSERLSRAAAQPKTRSSSERLSRAVAHLKPIQFKPGSSGPGINPQGRRGGRKADCQIGRSYRDDW